MTNNLSNNDNQDPKKDNFKPNELATGAATGAIIGAIIGTFLFSLIGGAFEATLLSSILGAIIGAIIGTLIKEVVLNKNSSGLNTLISFAVISAILAFLPILATLFAQRVAELAGCSSSTSQPISCLVLGIDLGDELYSMGSIYWLEIFSIPIGIVVFICSLFVRKSTGS